MNNLNVIIADDHPIVLFGIRKSLEQIEWVNVVGEFDYSGSQAIKALKEEGIYTVLINRKSNFPSLSLAALR